MNITTIAYWASTVLVSLLYLTSVTPRPRSLASGFPPTSSGC
ncbi:hypothetical protein [Neomesorhizobium albiziae]